MSLNIPPGKNSIVIVYSPGYNLAWIEPLRVKYPNVNFILFEMNDLSRAMLRSRGFIGTPTARFYPNGNSAITIQGNLGPVPIERYIAAYKF